MPLRLRSAFLLTSFLTLTVSQLLPGCGLQAEGERCSSKNGNKDCQTGLICTSASDLRNGSDGVDRCCPETGTTVSACRPGTSGGNSLGGASGLGGAGGLSGLGGFGGTGNALGETCDYTSECKIGLVCGPSGLCQYQCLEDRDCDSSEVCTKNLCVTP